MYKVELRDELGNITVKRFDTYEEACDFYYATQLAFVYIEMRLSNPMEVIDHCYMAGSKLEPIWLGGSDDINSEN